MSYQNDTQKLAKNIFTNFLTKMAQKAMLRNRKIDQTAVAICGEDRA